MSSFGSSIYDVGPSQGTPAIGTPLRNPKPNQDYIASGPGRLMPTIPQMLPKDFDDVTRHFGNRTYEAMLTDPTVYSSYLALKLAILAGKIQVQPKVKPEGYRYTSPDVRASKKPKGGESSSGSSKPSGSPTGSARQPQSGSSVSPSGVQGATSTPGLSPDEAQAQEVAEFCERELARPKSPLKKTMLQILDCMAFGAKLGEVTREPAESGQDKGKLVLKSIKIKPEWAWQYVVDAFLNVVGIITFVPPGLVGGAQAAKAGGFLILPPEKFAIMTWLPVNDDPRGTSALRAAYDWWNIKQQTKPYYYAHLQRFGSPSLDGELSPDDISASTAIDKTTGMEISGKFDSPGQRFFDQLTAFQNNSVIVRPAGSKLTIVEPRSNGEAFLNGFDLFDRQICLAIGLQTRASMEAKHGSKADSDTAENTRGLIIDYGREAISDWLEKQVLYESVRLNFGQDVADNLLPCVVIGDTEAQDFAANVTAVSGAGYTVGPSQLKGLDNFLGMPERDEEADQAHADEQAKKAVDMAAQLKPAGPGSPPGQPAKGKPAEKKPATKGKK